MRAFIPRKRFEAFPRSGGGVPSTWLFVQLNHPGHPAAGTLALLMEGKGSKPRVSSMVNSSANATVGARASASSSTTAGARSSSRSSATVGAGASARIGTEKGAKTAQEAA